MNVYPQTLANGGTAATSITATDEWQRVSVTFPYNSGLGSPYIGFVSPQQSRTFYFWGWQIEAQDQPTSYISTLGSAVTRAADVYSSISYTRKTDYAYIDIDIHDFWNDKESTIYVESETNIPDYTLGNYNASVFGFSPDEGRVQVRYDNTGGIEALGIIKVSGSTVSIFDMAPATPTFVTSSKVALTLKKDDYSLSVNGSPVVSDTGGEMPIPTRLFFGSYRELASPTNSEQLNGTISKLSYYNKKLSNAELVALTENN
jgi:hypothetical protein